MNLMMPPAGGHLPIEEHAIVGDLRTVALIGTDGSTKQMYLPDTDIVMIRFLGFPQAFTHLALVSAAVNLDRALDRT